MQQSFDAVSYSRDVGRELIADFETAARATTPGLIGSARERPVRRKLEHLLPVGIGVGSGCVIDSFGGTSKQQDVVLYEKAFCPIFSVNETPETTYYPCEGVIAVGEVKSTVASKELTDIFEKIHSVKMLKRFTKASKSVLSGKESICFRKYGSNVTIRGTQEEEFNQTETPFDQIFGFAIAGSLGITDKTFCAKFAELASRTDDHLSPNLIVLLNEGVVFPLAGGSEPTILLSQKDATGFYFANKGEENFQFLLSLLYQVFRQGRTVESSAFERYITHDGILRVSFNGKYIPISRG
jgi:hypothetical protein